MPNEIETRHLSKPEKPTPLASKCSTNKIDCLSNSDNPEETAFCPRDMTNFQEVITKSIGDFGLAQFIMVFSLRGGSTILAWAMIMMSYAGATPKWWSVSKISNGTGGFTEIRKFKVCPTNINETIVFDHSVKSIVSQWTLVCDRKWIPSQITTLQMIGVLIGASICGQIGDRIGRKKTTILFFFIMVLFTFISAFPTYWQVMAACRLFIGMALGGYMAIHYSYFVEFIGISWRTSMNAIPFWSFGVMTFGLTMMYVDDWTKIALGSAIFSVPVLIGFCFLPESARWLFIKGRQEEGKKVLQRMAKWNRMEKPDIEYLHISQEKDTMTNYSYITLFANRSTRYPVIVCSIMWFCCTVIYYGFTFGVSKLSGNAGMNMFLFGLTETAAVGLTWLLSKVLGRRKLEIFLLLLAASFSLAIFIQYFAAVEFYDSYRNIFAIIARCWLACAWLVAIIITQEVFPTAVRALGVGFASSVGRVGGIIGSQMQLVHELHNAVPYGVYALLLVITAVLVFFLEETYNKPLKDFLENGTNDSVGKAEIALSEINTNEDMDN